MNSKNVLKTKSYDEFVDEFYENIPKMRHKDYKKLSGALEMYIENKDYRRALRCCYLLSWCLRYKYVRK